MSQQLEFSEKELAAIRAEFCKGFTDQQFDVCMTFCRVRNLLPGKHVLFQLRRSKEWDEFAGAKVEVTKIVFITTIDASRLIAQRTGQYGGQAPEQYIYLDDNGAPSIVSEIPLPKLPVIPGQTALPREPWAVRTTLYRKDFDQPVTSVARFDAYASTYKTVNGPVLNEMWARRGPEQLAKCSEMLSLRRGWPEELGGVYLDLELKNENEEAPVSATPASVVPLPPPVPKVNHIPAVPTEAPRPSEQPKVEYHVKEVPATLPEHSGSTLSVEAAEAVIKATPMIEKFLENPEIQKKLAEEGEKVDHEEISRIKKEAATVLAANPSVKPAAELPPPVKKRGGRPKKSAESPDNGPQAGTDQGITQADIDNVAKPAPVVDEAGNKAAAEEFVNGITNFTSTEAATAGLPEPPDYSKLPEGKQLTDFIARVRALPEPGASIKDLGDYMLWLSNKVGQPSKNMTVGDWDRALANMETAKKNGTLKDLVKETGNAPLPAF